MEKPTKGIAVDGAAFGNPGPCEYRGIDIETGKILFHVKLGIGTNNIAEYVGLCHAALFAVKNDLKTVIYTDSQTALSWIKYNNPKSTLPRTEKTSQAYGILDRVVVAMKKQSITSDGIDITINDKITVSKWYTTEWGEIPADFENKKK